VISWIAALPIERTAVESEAEGQAPTHKEKKIGKDEPFVRRAEHTMQHLHSRLRTAPRHNSTATTAPAPDFHDADGSSDVEEFQEDTFNAFLPHLFPDDLPSFHGDPGQNLFYSSPRYGELEIMIPSYPG
jgi:hypothetical protein